MTLSETKYPNNSRTVAGAPQLFKDDVVLLCDTSTAPVTINLLDIPAGKWSTAWRMYINDNSNNALVNNITINAPVGFTINGGSSFVINSNKGSAIIKISSDTNFMAQSSVTSSVSAGGYSTIEDEGVPVTQRTTMNFVGAGVTVTDVGGKTQVTIPGGAGISTIPVANTVYVSKSGNNGTGLVERFDKPFLTIGAAITAVLAAFPVRTATTRIRIIVETGTYNETLVIHNFIDYDLNDSTIVSSVRCVLPSSDTFVALPDGQFHCIIYGNATFIADGLITAIALEIIGLNCFYLKLLVNANAFISTTTGRGCILQRTGYLKIVCNVIFADALLTDDAFCIAMSTNKTYEISGRSPQIEVHGAKIFNSASGNGGGVLSFQSGILPANFNILPNKAMLVNCELANYNVALPIVYCNNLNNTMVSLGSVTIRNTNLFSSSTSCISTLDTFSTGNGMNVYNYGAYSNKDFDKNYPPTIYVGALLVDPNVQFNQGEVI